MGEIKVTNKYINDVQWLQAPARPFLKTNTVDIWKINVSSNISQISQFLAVMNVDEIDRANAFLRTDDRNRSIIARGALRTILGRYLRKSSTLLEFGKDRNNKPFIKNSEGVQPLFNLSHSGDWILLAVSDTEIGIDIEYINSKFKYLDILPDYFNEQEIKFICQNLSDDRFFMHWTRKEALAKALGTGLDSQLKDFPSLNGEHLINKQIIPAHNNWLISSFYLNSNYIASLANDVNAEENKYYEFNFPNQ